MAMPRDRIDSLRDSLLELSHLGSPVDLEVAAEEPRSCGLEIEQVGDSRIFELANGRWGYMADVCVTNQTSRSMYPLDQRLCLPWEEGVFELLEPYTMKVRNYKGGHWNFDCYKFPGKAGWELPFEQVINHQLTPNRRLPPRRRISGWLLGIGGLMPPTLFKNCPVEASLVITTSDHAEHSGSILFCTERLERKEQRLRPTPSLFADCTDDQQLNKNPNLPPRGFEIQDRGRGHASSVRIARQSP